jgi:hypothetical protein
MTLRCNDGEVLGGPRQAAATSAVPAAVTSEWLPLGGPEWLETLRAWHTGQVRACARTRRALATARGGDFEGLAEDVRLAAEELMRIIEVTAAEVTARADDEPAARGMDVSDLMLRRARGWLRIDELARDSMMEAGPNG